MLRLSADEGSREDQVLSLKNVSFSKGPRRSRCQILYDVSLTVGVGEIIAVAGSVRAGRPLLLEIAAGITSPDSGEVLLAGVDLAKVSARKRARVLREEICWAEIADLADGGLSIRRCVALPLLARGHGMRTAENIALEALDQMDVGHCGFRYWEELSGIERARAKLACGLAMRPRLLVLDNFYEGLSPRGGREIDRSLRLLVNELRCGVLMGVSEPDSAWSADRIWCLQHGVLTSVTQTTSSIALATELYERGESTAAAVIAGVSLEEHLRKLAAKNKLPTSRANGLLRKAETVNHALAAAQIYNRLQQKEITAWLDLRNDAAHALHSEYDEAQVSAVIRAVHNLIVRFPV